VVEHVRILLYFSLGAKTKWTGNADLAFSSSALVFYGVAIGASCVEITNCGKGFRGGVFSVWAGENFSVYRMKLYGE
jgi:hypothetical protein